jgi:SAM-dependent methyltransferase
MSNVHPAAAAGFSAKADTYVRGRPDYPVEVDGWLRTELGLRKDRRVLDLGAGTGKFSKVLLATGAKVVALDAVPAMLDQLTERYPEVGATLGDAEALPFEDASFDAVVCAQSFHWFAKATVLAEIRRVLRSGGHLGLIWNVRDESVEWVSALTKIMEPFEGDVPRYHTQKWRGLFPAEGFSALEEKQFSNEHTGFPEQVIVDRTLSTSFIAALEPEEQDRVASQIRELIAATPELARRSSVTFPYTTVVLSCRKLLAERTDLPD